MRFTRAVERDRRRNGRARQDFVSDWKTERVPHRASAKKRNQGGRAGNAVYCQRCGAKLHPKRASRRQLYCSYRCRDEARRGRNFAVSATTRRGSPAIPRSVENRPLVSTSCKNGFVGRTPSIIGPQIVIETEIIAGRSWKSVVSPHGVCCEVATCAGAIHWGAHDALAARRQDIEAQSITTTLMLEAKVVESTTKPAPAPTVHPVVEFETKPTNKSKPKVVSAVDFGSTDIDDEFRFDPDDNQRGGLAHGQKDRSNRQR